MVSPKNSPGNYKGLGKPTKLQSGLFKAGGLSIALSSFQSGNALYAQISFSIHHYDNFGYYLVMFKCIFCFKDICHCLLKK